MIGPWGRPRGFKVAPKTFLQIRAQALATRRGLGILDSPINMVDLLENRLDANGIRYHVVENTRIRGDAARAVPEQGLLLITDFAHRALYEHDSEYELLVPHELAHFVLRHSASFSRVIPGEVHYAFEDSEVQADQFSHEFVMPVVLVQRHCQSVEEIRFAFNVPKRDAQIRHDVLRHEGLISW